VTGRRQSHILVKCAGCGHESKIDAPTLEPLIKDDLTVNTVSEIYTRLKCKLCDNDHAAVFDDTGQILIDPLNLSLCDHCGNPIVLPRLIALGNTSVCTICSEGGHETEVSRHRHPADDKSCPRCASPMAVRQNSQNGNLFLGCSKFPNCRGTAPMQS
jgi:hypothetical protein